MSLKQRDETGSLSIKAYEFMNHLCEEAGERELPAQLVKTFLYICIHDDCTQAELAAATQMSASSVSRNISWLSARHRLGKEGLGWVRRYQDSRDHKAKRVCLTQQGKQVRSKVVKPLAHAGMPQESHNDFFLKAEVTFSDGRNELAEEGSFLEGKGVVYLYPYADQDDYETREVAARGRIISILHSEASLEEIHEWLDSESQDFCDAGNTLRYLLDWDNETRVRLETYRVLILEWFEVSEKYRGKGLGLLLAKKLIYAAGGRGQCLLIQPMQHDNKGKNDVKRLERFWQAISEEAVYDNDNYTVYVEVFD